MNDEIVSGGVDHRRHPGKSDCRATGSSLQAEETWLSKRRIAPKWPTSKASKAWLGRKPRRFRK
jgi:hypothetical protein